jgi:hypothetical protein
MITDYHFDLVEKHMCSETIFYYEDNEYIDDIGYTTNTYYTYFKARC